MSIADYIEQAREAVAERRRQNDEREAQMLARDLEAAVEHREVVARSAANAARVERERVAEARRRFEKAWGSDAAKVIWPFDGAHALGLRLGRGGPDPRAWLVFQGAGSATRMDAARKIAGDLGLEPGGLHAPDAYAVAQATMLLGRLHGPVLAVNPTDAELRKLAAR